MKIAIAMDSFKGSLASYQAGKAVEMGILSVAPTATTLVCEVSDGGEGSLQAIKNSLDSFEEIVCSVVNSLNQEIDATYLITEWRGKKTAIIESALVIGIESITPTEGTTAKGSSYGIGQLLADAIARGCQQIVVFLGGTATSDGGLGMLHGLLGEEAKKEHNLLFQEESIADYSVLSSKFPKIEIYIGSDVTNPFSGSTGFATIFAKQKGASREQIKHLAIQSEKMEKQVKDQMGISLNEIVGTGAAGGLAGALTLLGGKIYSGFDLISEMTNLTSILETADVIYTGEGSIDSQSMQGKLPFKICEIAEASGIPVIALTGTREEELGVLSENLLGVFSIQQGVTTLEEALKEATAVKNLKLIASQTFKLFQWKT